MALKRNSNGTYVIRSKKELEKALTLMRELAEERKRIEEEYGLTEIMIDAVELKKAATSFAVKEKIDRIEMPDGAYFKMIEQSQNRRWILTQDELEEAGRPKGAKALLPILKKLFPDKDERKAIVNSITKRVVIPQEIDELVSTGVLDPKKIAPAFVEEKKAPYLRMYEPSGEGE